MYSQATTVARYLAELPEDRRAVMEAVLRVIRANLDPRLAEGIHYGMIGWAVPHSIYPAGYHCDPTQPLPFASLAAQKNHIAVYVFCLYTDPREVERFTVAWRATGKKLDMGKSCVRFKRVEDVPLEVLGEAFRRMTVEQFIAQYESSLASTRAAASARKPKSGAVAKAGAPASGARRTEAASKGKATARPGPAKARQSSAKTAAPTRSKAGGKSPRGTRPASAAEPTGPKSKATKRGATRAGAPESNRPQSKPPKAGAATKVRSGSARARP
jgi:hypothetical protein